MRRLPDSDDILAVWTYSYLWRAPRVPAISSDDGGTGHHPKLIEQSPYHVYGYTGIAFVGDHVYLTCIARPRLRLPGAPRGRSGLPRPASDGAPLAWFCR